MFQIYWNWSCKDNRICVQTFKGGAKEKGILQQLLLSVKSTYSTIHMIAET